ncbi:MAG: prolipoprotein diacylglyceryl transferase [Clostridia bacterium]|nr:prolipoprotein diacylglyceryl transferase [Clostridia bacterium]MBR6745230.1 prolipoprotein diacylglyceryl transferase [Clostridia bacterium]
MYNESIISFPGLGIDEFILNRVAFSFKIGSHTFTVMWYGLIICLAIFTAFGYFVYRAKQQGLIFDDMLDIALVTVVTAVIGARLYFVVFYGGYLETDGTFIENVLGTLYNIIAVWEGGLAIYGGIIFGALAVAYMARRKKISFFKLGDLAVPSVMLGQAIGRWGNFCNGEAFGSQTTLPWRMGLCNSETNFRTLFVHPTFFYESLWNVIGFTLINVFYQKRRYYGEIIIWYFSWYGLGRTFIELLRTDSLMIGSLRVSSLLSALLVLILLPTGIFLRRLCKKYTEEGLLKADEITSIKTLLAIFFSKRKAKNIKAE